MIRELKHYKREGNVIRVWRGRLPKAEPYTGPQWLTAKQWRILGNVIQTNGVRLGWLDLVRKDKQSGLTVWTNYLRGSKPTNTIPFPYPCREQLEGDYRLAMQEWHKYHPDLDYDDFWYWFDEVMWLEGQLKQRHGVTQAELDTLAYGEAV